MNTFFNSCVKVDLDSIERQLSRKQNAALKAALINQGLFGPCVKRIDARKIGSALYVSILTQRSDGALFEWTGRMNLKGVPRIRFVCNVAA